MTLHKLAVATILCFQWCLADGFLFYGHQKQQKIELDFSRESIKKTALNLEEGDNPDDLGTPTMRSQWSRRKLLHSSAAASIAMLSTSVFPRATNAVPPLTVEEADSLIVKAQRKLRPKPFQTLRPRLDKDFATLLMAASHQSLDDLDCVPMDQFQQDYSIIRDLEYGQYAADIGISASLPTKVDLSDPTYFDFFSFAQYAAINREINPDAPFVFTEQKPTISSVSSVADILTAKDSDLQLGPATIVRRDISLTNGQLSTAHAHGVGGAILNHLNNVYGGTADALPSLPLNTRPGSATLLNSLNQLVKLHLKSGYAFGGSAEIAKEGTAFGDASGTKFVLTLTAPATLWSGQAIQQMIKGGGVQLHNDFLLKATNELMARCGYHFTKQEMKYEGAQSIVSFYIG